MGRFSQNTLGAIFMMLSMAGFVLNDTFMQLSMREVGLFQALLIRGLFASVLMALLCAIMGGFRTPHGIVPALKHPSVLWRTIGETGGTFFFLTALFHMPIANVTAVLQVLPLTITLAAALFLGEHVGSRRWTAIIVGFLGVLLILRPGSDGFNIYALSALAATGFITLRDLATRQIPNSTPSLLVSCLTAITVTMLGAIGCLFQPWQAVEIQHVMLLASAASIIIFGYVFSISAMRHGDVGFVSPFRYSILIWALLLGYLVFGETPDTISLIGASIVVASGLFTFHRERRLARQNGIERVFD